MAPDGRCTADPAVRLEPVSGVDVVSARGAARHARGRSPAHRRLPPAPGASAWLRTPGRRRSRAPGRGRHAVDGAAAVLLLPPADEDLPCRRSAKARGRRRPSPATRRVGPRLPREIGRPPGPLHPGAGHALSRRPLRPRRGRARRRPGLRPQGGLPPGGRGPRRSRAAAGAVGGGGAAGRLAGARQPFAGLARTCDAGAARNAVRAIEILAAGRAREPDGGPPSPRRAGPSRHRRSPPSVWRSSSEARGGACGAASEAASGPRAPEAAERERAPARPCGAEQETARADRERARGRSAESGLRPGGGAREAQARARAGEEERARAAQARGRRETIQAPEERDRRGCASSAT